MENCKNPKSVTLLIKSPTKYGMVQTKDAIRDGLRALYNTIQDGCVIPGAGAYELQVSKVLDALPAKGKNSVGVKMFAKAILCIPKTLVSNSGHDTQGLINQALSFEAGDGILGVDLENGSVFTPSQVGIYDVYAAKKQLIDAR